MQQLPLLGLYSMDTLSDEEELPFIMQCRKPLKLGGMRTADIQVLCKVDWPHEFVYSADSKPAKYESLFVPLFVSRYVKIMAIQKPDVMALMSSHLTELMADTELYGWEAVKAFHAIWLHQMEQGRATC